MTTDTIPEIAVFLVAGGAFGAVIDTVPDGAQEWTAFGLLAVVLLWFMHKQSKLQDATIATMSEVAKALALLTQRATDAQHETEAKRADIIDRLNSLDAHILRNGERIERLEVVSRKL